jgi:hypothetical protein
MSPPSSSPPTGATHQKVLVNFLHLSLQGVPDFSGRVGAICRLPFGCAPVRRRLYPRPRPAPGQHVNRGRGACRNVQ